MDIKAKIMELVEKIQSDKALQAKFKENPVEAVESLLNVDLPDDMVEKIVDGIKAKLTADKLAGGLGALKKLF